jgi:signal transduction histidine kinase
MESQEQQDYFCVTVYRLVQEALTNVARHSLASSVKVFLHSNDDAYLSISISDDGQGMTTSQNTKEGLGLLGMRERVASLKGEFQLDSRVGEGVHIQIRLPFMPAKF